MNKVTNKAERVIDAVLAYEELGWKTIPVGMDKIAWLKGWQQAGTYEGQSVEDRWVDKAHGNIAIATGALSGFWVLDIDIKKGVDGLASLQDHLLDFDLDKIGTLTARSPTGGYHLYFKIPDPKYLLKTGADILKGVDVRADKGYIVASPSGRFIDDLYKEYEWIIGTGNSNDEILEAPENLLEMVCSPPKKKGGSNVATRNATYSLNDPDDMYSGVMEGGRDSYIVKVISHCCNKGMDKGEVEHFVLEAASNCMPSFDSSKAIEKVDRLFPEFQKSRASTVEQKYTVSKPKNELDIKIEEFNERFCVLSISGSTITFDDQKFKDGSAETDCMSTFENFKKLYCNKKVRIQVGDVKPSKYKTYKVANEWIEHEDRRTYEKVVFDPSYNDADDVYNFWKGFAVEPQLDDASMFWWHVENVICGGDQECYVYVRKWLAHMFQKPADLSGTALVISSKQGIGKGAFTTILSKLLYDNNYIEIASMDQLLGNFNNLLMNKLLVVSNEATWGGNNKEAGRLKALVTDSNINIELKGKDTFPWKNYARFIFTSNDSWVVKIDADDRRFVFLDSSTEMKGNDEYFRELFKFRDSETGLRALMHDLMNEDITGWLPNKRPNISFSKALDSKYDSMPHVEKFIYEWIKDRCVQNFPKSQDWKSGYTIIHKQFYEEYKYWCSNNNIFDQYTTTSKFGTIIYGKLIPVIGNVKRKGNDTIRTVPCWGDIYEFYCENVIGCDPLWDKDDGDEDEEEYSSTDEFATFTDRKSVTELMKKIGTKTDTNKSQETQRIVKSDKTMSDVDAEKIARGLIEK